GPLGLLLKVDQPRRGGAAWRGVHASDLGRYDNFPRLSLLQPKRDDDGQVATAQADASAVGGQRRTVAARGVRLPDLILARLRIRVVQALEVDGIGDRDLEPRRVGVDELAGGKEEPELLLCRGAAGQAWIGEEAVRIE